MVGTPTRYQCSERRRNSSPRLTPTHTGEWLSVMPGYPATRRESCLKRPLRQTPKYRTATISLASCTSEKRNGLRPLRRLQKQSKPTRIGPTITTTSGVRSAAPVTLRAPGTPSKGRSRSTRATPGLRQSWMSWSFGKRDPRAKDPRRSTKPPSTKPMPSVPTLVKRGGQEGVGSGEHGVDAIESFRDDER